MRMTLAVLCTLAAGATIAPVAPAQSDPYRWCGVFGGGEATVTNCYFIAIEQCRMAVSGNGGFCVPNQFYDGRPVVTPEDAVVRGRRRIQG